jgi:two-component system chemotaxis sensor kinase CheA
MTSLDQFKEVFITECDELLADMEAMLVELTAQNATRDVLDAIFRCAHSIKGGSGAFGLDYITTFTHSLEALLDELRDGKRTASHEIVDILLRSCDILKEMLDYTREEQHPPSHLGQTELAALEALLQGGAQSPGSTPTSDDLPPDGDGQQAQGPRIYKVVFHPHAELFMTGNEPVFILRELCSLGQADIHCNTDDVPTLDALNPTQCYLKWEITLTTEHSEAEIAEVFEFVESVSDITITPLPAQEQAETATPPSPAGVARQQPQEPRANPPLARRTGENKASTSIRVELQKLDRLVNMVGELVITEAMIKAQTHHLQGDRFQDLLTGVEELSQQARELQEAVMNVRMQPVHSIFSRMPRIVRDLSSQLGKKITLTMEGEGTEVDKTVIEQLGDPLTHMIRNSIDHGIEMPDIRTANGKADTGTITLSASHESGRIIIRIIDDGHGINRQKVEEKAIANGLIPPDHGLSDEQIDNLIFEPGFSTAAKVTNISGRGVGMDVVRKNIEALDGMVSVTNHPGKGSEFKVSLPLTLAILDGMIVRVGTEQYIIPIINIVETLRPQPHELRAMQDNLDIINVRGEILPTVRLDEIFDIQGATAELSEALMVIIESNGEKIGIVVDELVGQQQVVIKNLEHNSTKIPGISGATILGDGKVSLILELSELRAMATARLVQASAQCA